VELFGADALGVELITGFVALAAPFGPEVEVW
jgi:hypothetical protein